MKNRNNYHQKYSSKVRHYWPKPEELTGKNKQWALSVNCGEELLAKDLYIRYKGFFKKIDTFGKFDCTMEFSKKMKLHCHARFEFYSDDKVYPFLFFINSISNKYTIYMIEISDHNKWDEYMSKNKSITNFYFSDNRIANRCTLCNTDYEGVIGKFPVTLAEELDLSSEDSESYYADSAA